MKKLPALLTGFLFISTLLQAQQKQAKFFAQLSGGPSFPLGKFADKSYTFAVNNNEPEGLAKTGLSLQASLGYHLSKTAGLLFLSGYSEHAQEASGYKEYMKQVILSAGLITNNVDVKTTSWKIVKLMAGGFLNTPLTSDEDLVLVTKVTVGACKTAIPEYSFKGYVTDGITTFGGTFNKTSLSWAFCYQVSMGLKYKLNNRLHLLLDVNSFNATAKKEYTFDPPPSPNGTPNGITYQKVKYKLAELNALVGIGVNF
jgi:hypothetical protein